MRIIKRIHNFGQSFTNMDLCKLQKLNDCNILGSIVDGEVKFIINNGR